MEFLWYIISRKSFFLLAQTSKKRQRLPKLACINQWNCELRANNEILLAEKRQWTLLCFILFKHYCMLESASTQKMCVLRWLTYQFILKKWNRSWSTCKGIQEFFVHFTIIDKSCGRKEFFWEDSFTRWHENEIFRDLARFLQKMQILHHSWK